MPNDRPLPKTVLRTARSGALAVLDTDGNPFCGRVGLATDLNGAPVFPLSELSGRPAWLKRDARVSLLVGSRGDGDELAAARLTINGSAVQLTGRDYDRARGRYLGRYPDAQYVDFGDFSLWRIEITAARWVGGFGAVKTLAAADLLTASDDWEAWFAMERRAVEHMNDDHADATALYATALCGAPDGDWRITGLDPEGIDMALGDRHVRFTYPTALEKAAGLRPALVKLVHSARTTT